MKNKGESSFFAQARQYAFFLLKFRLRTEKELFARLKKKNFSDECIKDTLDFLREKKFIDDKLFARAWIESRLKKPLGFRRLAVELRVKGVARDIIEERLQEAKKDYSEDEVVKGIIRQKLKKTIGIDPLKAKKRIYAYLLRRGFSPEAVIDSLSEIKQ